MPAAGRGVKATPLRHQEAIGGDTECGVMMKTAPTAAFEVSQSEFLFQFFVIPFDDPALTRSKSHKIATDSAPRPTVFISTVLML